MDLILFYSPGGGHRVCYIPFRPQLKSIEFYCVGQLFDSITMSFSFLNREIKMTHG